MFFLSLLSSSSLRNRSLGIAQATLRIDVSRTRSGEKRDAIVSASIADVALRIRSRSSHRYNDTALLMPELMR